MRVDVRDELGRLVGAIRVAGDCLYCGASLAGRRSDARWCSVAHRTYWVRVQRRLQRRLEHPRCVVCSEFIRYGQPGVNLSSVTCGKRKCRVVRWSWFHEPYRKEPHPLSPERRREIARHAAMVRWGYA